MKKGTVLKTIALIIVVIFTVTNTVSASPAVYTINVSQKVGKVTKRWKAPNGSSQSPAVSRQLPTADCLSPTVILIQDAHTNLEAQENVARIICELLPQIQKSFISSQALIGREAHEADVTPQTPFVGIEGALDEYDLKELRDFPIQKAKEEVGRAYVKDGKFIGAELASIIANQDFTLVGLEDEALLKKDFQAFYEVALKQSDIEEELDRLEEVIALLKEDVYNRDLKSFDDRAVSYEHEEVNVIEYLGTVYEMIDTCGLDLYEYITLMQFKEIYILEQSVNWTNIDQGIERLMSVLDSTSKDLSREAVGYYQKYKAGELPQKEIVVSILALAVKARIDTTSFYQLMHAQEYWQRSALCNMSTLISEVRKATHAIRRALARNEKEGVLIKLSEKLLTLQRLFTLSAEREDVAAYRADPSAYSLSTINRQLTNLRGSYASLTNLRGSLTNLRGSRGVDEALLEKVDTFYRLAEKRDQVMVDNLLKNMEKKNQSVGVIVAGGYHSQGIEDICKKNNINYISIMPNISTVKKDVAYMDRMLGHIGPLNPILSSPLQVSRINLAGKLAFGNEVFNTVVNTADYEMHGNILWIDGKPLTPENRELLINDLHKAAESNPERAADFNALADAIELLCTKENLVERIRDGIQKGQSLRDIWKREGEQIEGQVLFNGFMSDFEDYLVETMRSEKKVDPEVIVVVAQSIQDIMPRAYNEIKKVQDIQEVQATVFPLLRTAFLYGQTKAIKKKAGEALQSIITYPGMPLTTVQDALSILKDGLLLADEPGVPTSAERALCEIVSKRNVSREVASLIRDIVVGTNNISIIREVMNNVITTSPEEKSGMQSIRFLADCALEATDNSFISETIALLVNIITDEKTDDSFRIYALEEINRILIKGKGYAQGKTAELMPKIVEKRIDLITQENITALNTVFQNAHDNIVVHVAATALEKIASHPQVSDALFDYIIHTVRQTYENGNTFVKGKVVQTLTNIAMAHPRRGGDALRVLMELNNDLIRSSKDNIDEMQSTSAVLDVLAQTIEVSSYPVQVRIHHVAALRAVKSFLDQLEITNDVIICYAEEVTQEMAQNAFPHSLVTAFEGYNTSTCTIDFDTDSGCGYLSPYKHRTSQFPFKYDITPAISDEIRTESILQLKGGTERQILVVGSPSDKDVAEILKAYQEIGKKVSKNKKPILIIAPRFPLTEGEYDFGSLEVVYRNNKNKPLPSMAAADVLVLNTMGELLSFYAYADICVVGCDHNPLEPPSQGKGIIYFDGKWENNDASRQALEMNNGAKAYSQDEVERMVFDQSYRTEINNNAAQYARTFREHELRPTSISLAQYLLYVILSREYEGGEKDGSRTKRTTQEEKDTPSPITQDPKIQKYQKVLQDPASSKEELLPVLTEIQKIGDGVSAGIRTLLTRDLPQPNISLEVLEMQHKILTDNNIPIQTSMHKNGGVRTILTHQIPKEEKEKYMRAVFDKENDISLYSHDRDYRIPSSEQMQRNNMAILIDNTGVLLGYYLYEIKNRICEIHFINTFPLEEGRRVATRLASDMAIALIESGDAKKMQISSFIVKDGYAQRAIESAFKGKPIDKINEGDPEAEHHVIDLSLWTVAELKEQRPDIKSRESTIERFRNYREVTNTEKNEKKESDQAQEKEKRSQEKEQNSGSKTISKSASKRNPITWLKLFLYATGIMSFVFILVSQGRSFEETINKVEHAKTAFAVPFTVGGMLSLQNLGSFLRNKVVTGETVKPLFKRFNIYDYPGITLLSLGVGVLSVVFAFHAAIPSIVFTMSINIGIIITALGTLIVFARSMIHSDEEMNIGNSAEEAVQKQKLLSKVTDSNGGDEGGGIMTAKAMGLYRDGKYLLTSDITKDDLPYDVTIGDTSTIDQREIEKITHLSFGDVLLKHNTIEIPETIFLVSESDSGTSQLVRLGFMNGDRPVALKTIYLADLRTEKETPALRATANKMTLNQYKEGKILEYVLGGPQYHGIWIDKQGRYTIVTDVVPGDHPESSFGLSHITGDTFTDIFDIYERTKKSGYTPFTDLQYHILPDGKVAIIDAQVKHTDAEYPPEAALKKLISAVKFIISNLKNYAKENPQEEQHVKKILKDASITIAHFLKNNLDESKYIEKRLKDSSMPSVESPIKASILKPLFDQWFPKGTLANRLANGVFSPTWEEALFRYATFEIVADTIGMGWAVGIATIGFSVGHVAVQWLAQRNKPKEERDSFYETARDTLLASLVLTATYGFVGLFVSASSVVPFIVSTVLHMFINSRNSLKAFFLKPLMGKTFQAINMPLREVGFMSMYGALVSSVTGLLILSVPFITVGIFFAGIAAFAVGKASILKIQGKTTSPSFDQEKRTAMRIGVFTALSFIIMSSLPPFLSKIFAATQTPFSRDVLLYYRDYIKACLEGKIKYQIANYEIAWRSILNEYQQFGSPHGAIEARDFGKCMIHYHNSVVRSSIRGAPFSEEKYLKKVLELIDNDLRLLSQETEQEEKQAEPEKITATAMTADNPQYMAFCMVTDGIKIKSRSESESVAKSYGLSRNQIEAAYEFGKKLNDVELCKIIARIIVANINEKSNLRRHDLFIQNILTPYLRLISIGVGIPNEESNIFIQFGKLFSGGQLSSVKSGITLRNYVENFLDYINGGRRFTKDDTELNDIVEKYGYNIVLEPHYVRVNKIIDTITVNLPQYVNSSQKIRNIYVLEKIGISLLSPKGGESMMGDQDVIIMRDEIDKRLSHISRIVDKKEHVEEVNQSALENLGLTVTVEHARDVLEKLSMLDFSDRSEKERQRDSINSTAIHESKHKWEEERGILISDLEFSAHATEVIYGPNPFSSLSAFIYRMASFSLNTRYLNVKKTLNDTIQRAWQLAEQCAAGKLKEDALRREMIAIYKSYKPVTRYYTLPPIEAFRPVADKINKAFQKRSTAKYTKADRAGLLEDIKTSYDADNPELVAEVVEQISPRVKEWAKDFAATSIDTITDIDGIMLVDDADINDIALADTVNGTWVIKVNKSRINYILNKVVDKNAALKIIFGHELAEVRAREMKPELTKADYHTLAIFIEETIADYPEEFLETLKALIEKAKLDTVSMKEIAEREREKADYMFTFRKAVKDILDNKVNRTNLLEAREIREKNNNFILLVNPDKMEPYEVEMIQTMAQGRVNNVMTIGKYKEYAEHYPEETAEATVLYVGVATAPSPQNIGNIKIHAKALLDRNPDIRTVQISYFPLLINALIAQTKMTEPEVNVDALFGDKLNTDFIEEQEEDVIRAVRDAMKSHFIKIAA